MNTPTVIPFSEEKNVIDSVEVKNNEPTLLEFQSIEDNPAKSENNKVKKIKSEAFGTAVIRKSSKRLSKAWDWTTTKFPEKKKNTGPIAVDIEEEEKRIKEEEKRIEEEELRRENETRLDRANQQAMLTVQETLPLTDALLIQGFYFKSSSEPEPPKISSSKIITNNTNDNICESV